MATYNADKMLAGTQPRALPTAAGVKALSVATLTSPLALNDTINMLQLGSDPAIGSGGGPAIMGLALDCDDLDSNGSPTIVLAVGDGTVADRFITGTTVAQTGGVAYANKPGALGYKPFASSFSSYPSASLATYTIVAKVTTGPATWQNGSIRLIAEFSYDP
jgi:hypothetical protein